MGEAGEVSLAGQRLEDSQGELDEVGQVDPGFYLVGLGYFYCCFLDFLALLAIALGS